MQYLQVIGNLGADAKLVENNGNPFISFNVADTEKWRDEAGQDHERTSWISCAYNGGVDSPILPYLKAGTKVYVMGRQRTRVYSSEKERRMVAGINLSVQHIELVGGSMDQIPRRLINPETTEIIDVNKAFFVAVADFNKLPASRILVDKIGNKYSIAPEGWITSLAERLAQSQPQEEQQKLQEEQQKPQGEKTEIFG